MNFLHLTGVQTRLSAQQFYDECTYLSPTFEFEKVPEFIMEKLDERLLIGME